MKQLDLGSFSINDVEKFIKDQLPQIDPKKIDKVVQNAQFAFWTIVAENFPEVKHDDYDPMQTITFELWCKIAITWWLKNNHPKT